MRNNWLKKSMAVIISGMLLYANAASGQGAAEQSEMKGVATLEATQVMEAELESLQVESMPEAEAAALTEAEAQTEATTAALTQLEAQTEATTATLTQAEAQTEAATAALTQAETQTEAATAELIQMESMTESTAAETTNIDEDQEKEDTQEYSTEQPKESLTEENSVAEEIESEVAIEGSTEKTSAEASEAVTTEEETTKAESEEVFTEEETTAVESVEEMTEEVTFKEETTEEETTEEETSEETTEDSMQNEYVSRHMSDDGYLYEDTILYGNASLDAAVLTVLPGDMQVGVREVVECKDEPYWYRIICSVDEDCYEGYVQAEFVLLMSDIGLYSNTSVDQTDQFPADYQRLIAEIKKEHPNWSFRPVWVGLDFAGAVYGEKTINVNNNLVSMYIDPAYRCMETLGTDSTGAVYNYNWRTNTWYEWEPGFVAASLNATAYCMDTRNFLNSKNVFMFESLTFEESYQTAETCDAVLRGTFMHNTLVPGEEFTYAELLCWIGKQHDINPVMLASRLRQEQGVSGNKLVTGTYPGYENLYNHFNIMAAGKTVDEIVKKGLTVARKGSTFLLPNGEISEGAWNTPTKAIIGGALNIGSQFILKGQNTLYQQKFDLLDNGTGLYWHQYMQNLTAPITEGASVEKSYRELGALDSDFVFLVPVFENMPTTVSKLDTFVDRNNCLKNIWVNGVQILTDFEKEKTTYNCIVPYQMSEAIVSVETASPNASIDTREKTKRLQVGNNTVTFTVTAKNGEKKTYTVSIYRNAENTTDHTGEIKFNGISIKPAEKTVYVTFENGEKASLYMPFFETIETDISNKIYLKGIEPGTELTAMLRKINVVGSWYAEVYNPNTNTLCKAGDMIGTGFEIRMRHSSSKTLFVRCPIIVKGDIDGNGICNENDVSFAEEMLLKDSTFTDEMKYAVDVNNDTIFNILDLSAMKHTSLGR